jgi:hypothetical protein
MFETAQDDEFERGLRKKCECFDKENIGSIYRDELEMAVKSFEVDAKLKSRNLSFY